jgi:hypothetical protein
MLFLLSSCTTHTNKHTHHSLASNGGLSPASTRPKRADHAVCIHPGCVRLATTYTADGTVTQEPALLDLIQHVETHLIEEFRHCFPQLVEVLLQSQYLSVQDRLAVIQTWATEESAIKCGVLTQQRADWIRGRTITRNRAAKKSKPSAPGRRIGGQPGARGQATNTPRKRQHRSRSAPAVPPPSPSDALSPPIEDLSPSLASISPSLPLQDFTVDLGVGNFHPAPLPDAVPVAAAHLQQPGEWDALFDLYLNDNAFCVQDMFS